MGEEIGMNHRDRFEVNLPYDFAYYKISNAIAAHASASAEAANVLVFKISYYI